MFGSFFKFFKELDRRIKVTITGMGIYNWSQRLANQYKQLYAKSLGATAVELGLLNSIGSAVSTIFSLPLGWVVEKYSVKQVILFTLVCTCISATIYAVSGNWLMLIPAFIISGMNFLSQVVGGPFAKSSLLTIYNNRSFHNYRTAVFDKMNSKVAHYLTKGELLRILCTSGLSTYIIEQRHPGWGSSWRIYGRK